MSTMQPSAKAALITGASGGLGQFISLEYAQHGYKVMLSGRDIKKLAQTDAWIDAIISGSGNKPQVIRMADADLCQESHLETLAAAAIDFEINHVVFCAGLHSSLPVSSFNINAAQEMLDVNLVSVIKLVVRLQEHLKKIKGTIVYINSVAGKWATPGEAVYSASKHGMHGFFQALRRENSGIRIIEVFPGAIKTDMNVSRSDYSRLMAPSEAAHIIFRNAQPEYVTLQLDELHLSRSL